MPGFRYIAYASDGTRETGRQDAANEELALQRLAELGLTVTEIGPETGASQSSGSGGRPGAAQQADLAEQLAVLFGAGLTAPQVTAIVAQSSGSAAIRKHFRRMDQLIADGTPFDQALSQGSDLLSPLFGILAGIGQHAGTPGQQMSALATTLRRQARMTSQITGALVYPAILMAGGLGMVIFMALFLAPRLSVIFTSVGQPVPSGIAGFITIGNWLMGWALPAVMTSLGICCALVYRRGVPLALRLALSLPLIGPAMREAGIVRIVRAVQLMLEAGLSLASALRTAAQSFATDPAAPAFAAAAEMLEQGSRASSVLADDTSLPILLRELFMIGEETNSLPRVLSAVASGLEDRVEHRLNRIMALLTPLLTLLIGGAIAAIVASVMGAVLSVNDVAI